MVTSVIVSVLVLAAGVGMSPGRRPPWALQPATSPRPRVGARPLALRTHVWAAVPVDDNTDDDNIVVDSLRALGLIRRGVERPVVGRKAYVRWWERIRALVVLAGLVTALGVALAATIGVIVLGAGFLLEQAIS